LASQEIGEARGYAVCDGERHGVYPPAADRDGA